MMGVGVLGVGVLMEVMMMMRMMIFDLKSHIFLESI